MSLCSAATSKRCALLWQKGLEILEESLAEKVVKGEYLALAGNLSSFGDRRTVPIVFHAQYEEILNFFDKSLSKHSTEMSEKEALSKALEDIKNQYPQLPTTAESLSHRFSFHGFLMWEPQPGDILLRYEDQHLVEINEISLRPKINSSGDPVMVPFGHTLRQWMERVYREDKVVLLRRPELNSPEKHTELMESLEQEARVKRKAWWDKVAKQREKREREQRERTQHRPWWPNFPGSPAYKD